MKRASLCLRGDKPEFVFKRRQTRAMTRQWKEEEEREEQEEEGEGELGTEEEDDDNDKEEQKRKIQKLQGNINATS